MTYLPVSPRFLEAMLPAIEAGSVSCANCRHWRIVSDGMVEKLPYAECSKNHYGGRRIDRNVGPDFAGVVAQRAKDCGDFDNMAEE